MGGLAGTAAKLLASLDLDTKPFERGAKRVDGSIKKMEGRFGKLGSIAAKGAARAATSLAAAGAVAYRDAGEACGRGASLGGEHALMARRTAATPPAHHEG